jgi:hypothetical protein
VIGHDEVNFYKVGGFRRSNEKSGLDRWTPGVGQPSIERDVKDILEAELDCLLLRRIRKPVEWFERLRLLVCQEGEDLIYDRWFGFFPDEGAGDCAFAERTPVSAKLSAPTMSFDFNPNVLVFMIWFV